MKNRSITRTAFSLFVFAILSHQALSFEPANKKMSPEAKALLELHYTISGK